MYLNIDGVGEELEGQANVPMPLVSVGGLAPGQRMIMSRRTVRITIADATGIVIEAMRCAVENRDPGIHPVVSMSWRDERLKVTLSQRSALGCIYFFTDAGYIGRLSETAESASIDCRKLPSGTHTLWSVPETSDGILLPPVKSDLLIAARYKFSCDGGKPAYSVPFEAPDVKMNLKVTRIDGIDTVNTKVYVADELMGESDKAEFDMSIPLKDVPSGTQDVEVVGIGKDGQKYAAEVGKVEITNQFWNSYIVGTTEYRTVQANRPAIEKLEQDASSWFARAQAEPNFSLINHLGGSSSFTNSSGNLTTSYFSTLITPGKSAEYISNARRALTQMAQILVHDGSLYKRIKMKAAARTYFRRAYYAAGDNSITGRSAKTALDEMEETR
jgi:hypothetical protein